ncbi:MAG: PAS domain-containing protein [Chloroflexaceae bacterium]|nr:PAS domain-containing protein [Chloroflexaceae bacterium]
MPPLRQQLAERERAYRDLAVRYTPAPATQQHQLLEAVLDHASASILVKDRDGTIIFSNRQHNDLLGVLSDDILGKTAHDLHPEQIAQALWESEQHILATARPIVIEETVLLQDGMHTLLVFKFPIFDAQQQVIAVGIISTDITERKKIEQHLQQQLVLFTNLIETLPFPVFYKDADGIYQGCNRLFAEALFGQSVDAVVGKGLYDLFPQEQADFYAQQDRQLLEQGNLQVYERQLTFADGGEHTILFISRCCLKPITYL